VARGPAEVTCDANCQEPNLATCNGTSGGQCTNLDLGDETCGQGVCEVTTARCAAGSPQSCVPNLGAATAETCDGIDNNCNGSTDEGLPVDDYEPNDSCSSHFFLGLLGEGLTATRNDMTIYTDGDEDWYRELTTEDFTTCTTGVDEEYAYTITMIPPAGRDYDIQVCASSGFSDTSCPLETECFTSDFGGDSTESMTLTWKGPCGGGTNDGRSFFINVYPFGGADSCEPYTLSTTFEKTN
jgi:hypothetical protein